jgi:hypothetical protein
LGEFSRRTTARLRASLPLRLALPYLEPFLARNLEKEIRKDTLIVYCARDALAAGAPPEADAARKLLAAAREIDREFFASVADFPVRIDISYERIEPLRLRRIERALPLCYRILHAWQRGLRLRDEMPRKALARELGDIFGLYCEETAALSRGVRIPALLAPLRARFADTLLREMRQAAAGVAQDIAAQKPR